ncbi:carboxylesterase/lipase family protein [Nakamurella flavida]|uniref:Carboxylic ester hydrolase n=1 Tax=Nakamurella flavida TaxID=363630 RepID=A0A938YMC4_9ACTN|nr:carboxylesterase/lipase family protein [Nakamurella flavida]
MQPSDAYPHGPVGTDSDGPVVSTPAGAVRGEQVGSVSVWRGIRYAAPPTGDLRWRAPVPPEPWTGIRDALRFGPAAPQGVGPMIDLGVGVRQDEDCLFLNVWAPAEPAAPRPVMVWVHGGAYVLGSASQALYDGRSLVEAGDVVVVTINYRLGVLGFLDLTATGGDEGDGSFDGNLALRDVILALQWVRDGIAGFGGDPDCVTVFGESAGGGMVTTLMATPSARGLFHRAIAQSSPATSVYDRARAATVVRRFVELVDPDGGADRATRLRALPVEALVEAGQVLFSEVPSTAPGTLAFAPTVDGDLVPDYPVAVFARGEAAPVPLLIGTNKDEASLFARMKSPLMPVQTDTIEEMFAQIAVEHPELVLPERAQVVSAYSGMRVRAVGLGIARDIGFRMPTVWVAEGHAAVAAVHLYRFDHATPVLKLLRIGATHATELPYVWGNLVHGPRDVTFKLGGLAAARVLSAAMQQRWIAFARTGSPDHPDAVSWPAYTSPVRATMVFDRTETVVEDLDRNLRETWGAEPLAFR